MLLRLEAHRCDMSVDDARLGLVRDACRAGSVAAVVSGSIRTDAGRTISALVIDRGGALLARYDKQHLDRRGSAASGAPSPRAQMGGST
jgi:D-alanyl-D-alanine dipeptidase